MDLIVKAKPAMIYWYCWVEPCHPIPLCLNCTSPKHGFGGFVRFLGPLAEFFTILGLVWTFWTTKPMPQCLGRILSAFFSGLTLKTEQELSACLWVLEAALGRQSAGILAETDWIGDVKQDYLDLDGTCWISIHFRVETLPGHVLKIWFPLWQSDFTTDKHH